MWANVPSPSIVRFSPSARAKQDIAHHFRMAMPLQPIRWLPKIVFVGVTTAITATASLLTGCGGDGGSSPRLNGAGASFPAAIYTRWFRDLSSEGVKVSYQSVGSGSGVRQFIAKTVDFGASEVPMKDEAKSRWLTGWFRSP